METIKGQVTEKVTESIRDFETLTIKLPLGNPNLKLIHTNQFVWTELPTDVFELKNLGLLASKMNSKYTRYTNYETNKWYIENVTINNDGDKATIELGVNPFASSLTQYKDDRYDFEDAYKQAYEKNNSTDSSSKVSSVSGTNTTLGGGEGKTINNAVAKIVGKTTDELKKAKLIHAWLINHCPYSSYSNSKYSSAVSVYKVVTSGKKVNCADTSRLTRAMMASAGITANVRHIPGHYFTEMKCNGKWYCSDATSKRRTFNYYWTSGSSNNKYTKRVGSNNGKNPES